MQKGDVPLFKHLSDIYTRATTTISRCWWNGTGQRPARFADQVFSATERAMPATPPATSIYNPIRSPTRSISTRRARQWSIAPIERARAFRPDPELFKGAAYEVSPQCRIRVTTTTPSRQSCLDTAGTPTSARPFRPWTMRASDALSEKNIP